MRFRRASAFTLLELMLVVAIIGMIAALAAMRLDYLLPKYRLRGGAREVGALFKEARSRAAGMGRDVYVQVNVSQGTYWMLAPFRVLGDDGLPKEPPEWRYEEVLKRALPSDGGRGVEFSDVVLGPEQVVSSGRALVRFSPQSASSHVIVNLRLDEAAMAVRMNGLTGAVSFHDGRKDADALLEDTGD